MSQPNWITPAGSLGQFASNTATNIRLRARPKSPSRIVNYTILNGSLPNGLIYTSRNNIFTISGTPTGVLKDTTYTFTVRATDEFNNLRDRTFNIVILTSQLPTFTISSGLLLSITDSVYINESINYNTSILNDKVTMYVTSGSLPPGLYLDPNTCKIQGYALPPVSINNSPITKSYKFSVTLYSKLGQVSTNYRIVVRNYQLDYRTVKPRKPVIFNSQPPRLPIPNDDPYYDYYYINDKVPVFKSGDYVSLKIMGHDFDGSEVSYIFGTMPPGLTGNSNTGWVTGTPVIGRGLNRYSFQVKVRKPNNIESSNYGFSLFISNGVTNDVKFTSNTNLGTILNNTISTLSIAATSAQDLSYRLVSGTLPPNLTLEQNGDISGKVAFQPKRTALKKDETSTFTFTVEAYSSAYPLVKLSKTFTITVKQYFTEVTENIYFKATPNKTQRNIINSLLQDTNLIPDDYLYRPYDDNFGKANSVTFVHAYGIKSSTREQYIEAMKKNHYWRNITLGELKTAVARDDNGNIIYEVVYSEIKDDLVNSLGKSLPEQLVWPTYVSLQIGPYLTSEGFLYTSFSNITAQELGQFYTSQTPGTTNKFYPASLINMKNTLIKNIGIVYNSNLLPKWMATQQENGNVLGYVQAFVICYTKPGYAKTVLNNIQNDWPYKLNQINVTLDRYFIDKSTTYNYNSYLENPNWISLPSAYPAPNPGDSKDYVVLFPQKTIFPESNN